MYIGLYIISFIVYILIPTSPTACTSTITTWEDFNYKAFNKNLKIWLSFWYTAQPLRSLLISSYTRHTHAQHARTTHRARTTCTQNTHAKTLTHTQRTTCTHNTHAYATRTHNTQHNTRAHTHSTKKSVSNNCKCRESSTLRAMILRGELWVLVRELLSLWCLGWGAWTNVVSPSIWLVFEFSGLFPLQHLFKRPWCE